MKKNLVLLLLFGFYGCGSYENNEPSIKGNDNEILIFAETVRVSQNRHFQVYNRFTSDLNDLDIYDEKIWPKANCSQEGLCTLLSSDSDFSMATSGETEMIECIHHNKYGKEICELFKQKFQDKIMSVGRSN